MIRYLILFSIRNKILVISFALIWAAMGFWIAIRAPIDALPDISDNQILIYTPWPDHNPIEIEKKITQPISNALRGMPYIHTVRGSSDVGFSLIHLIVQDSGDSKNIRDEIEKRLSRIVVDLPKDARPIIAPNGIPTGQILWYCVEGLNTDLVSLRSIQKKVIAPAIAKLSGVAEVSTVGGFDAEIHVHAKESTLRNAGLSLQEIESILSQHLAEKGHVEPTQNYETLLSSLEKLVLKDSFGKEFRLRDLANVRLGVASRQGVFEKDGSETVAGIVHLSYGANTLDVTQRVISELQKIGDTLPTNMRVTPVYDRRTLIQGSVFTLTRTLIESMLVTMASVILIMRHVRSGIAICLSLPVAVLSAFIALHMLKVLGVADIQTNIMSLVGIVVSIGVLIDSSIVMVENVSHRLKHCVGDAPVVGNVDEIVVTACATVARPAFFALLIMLVSFAPVFALQGIDGKMYRPLAWTKSLTLASVAFLAITLVPALSSVFIRGRIRSESDVIWLRNVAYVYRKWLAYLLERPAPLVIVLCCLCIVGTAVTNYEWGLRFVVAISIAIAWQFSTTTISRCMVPVGFVVLGLVSQVAMPKVQLALRLPLDEGMLMDMPITIPRVTTSQAADDLKARNMILCRFPEVKMVTGKAGRADTAFDPAPMDMIETMIEFRPYHQWPRRKLPKEIAMRQAQDLESALVASRFIAPLDAGTYSIDETVRIGLDYFDAIQREVCWQMTQVFQNNLADELARHLSKRLADHLFQRGELLKEMSEIGTNSLVVKVEGSDVLRLAKQLDTSSIHIYINQLVARMFVDGHLRHLNSQPLSRQRITLLHDDPRHALGMRNIFSVFGSTIGMRPSSIEDSFLSSCRTIADQRWSEFMAHLNTTLQSRAAKTWSYIVCDELFRTRGIANKELADRWDQVLAAKYLQRKSNTEIHSQSHHGFSSVSALPIVDPHPAFDELLQTLNNRFESRIQLWSHDHASLTHGIGEMDAAVKMPGWANVWTKPIQNRIDMLATGVNSEIGIRILGPDLDEIAKLSERIADTLRPIPGASNIIADPMRDKEYVDFSAERRPPDSNGRMPMHDRIDESRLGELVFRGISIGELGNQQDALKVRLFAEVEPHENQIKILRREGPATIKSENGLMRTYVRMNANKVNPESLVSQAQEAIRKHVNLPQGVNLEWTGQFEHGGRTQRAMLWIVPSSILIIFALLYATFHDLADACMMFVAVPGAIAGGMICQAILGYPLSMAVGIGYLACFGMASATSMIMVIYLRESINAAGGLDCLSEEQLKIAVLDGAVHRLRPKILTEVTMIAGLVPMVWSTGIGADVIRPMAAPVLGGILVADEVVDLLVPVMFYSIRRNRIERIRSQQAQEEPLTR